MSTREALREFEPIFVRHGIRAASMYAMSDSEFRTTLNRILEAGAAPSAGDARAAAGRPAKPGGAKPPASRLGAPGPARPAIAPPARASRLAAPPSRPAAPAGPRAGRLPPAARPAASRLAGGAKPPPARAPPTDPPRRAVHRVGPIGDAEAFLGALQERGREKRREAAARRVAALEDLQREIAGPRGRVIGDPEEEPGPGGRAE